MQIFLGRNILIIFVLLATPQITAIGRPSGNGQSKKNTKRECQIPATLMELDNLKAIAALLKEKQGEMLPPVAACPPKKRENADHQPNASMPSSGDLHKILRTSTAQERQGLQPLVTYQHKELGTQKEESTWRPRTQQERNTESFVDFVFTAGVVIVVVGIAVIWTVVEYIKEQRLRALEKRRDRQAKNRFLRSS